MIGGNHHNTLGVIRGMGYKGIFPIVIIVCNGSREPHVRYSRFIKQFYKVGNDIDVISTLKKIASTLSGKAVVIACSDGVSSVLDLHHNELKTHFIMPGTEEEGRLTRFMDKESMSQLGREVGFNVPETWIVESESDIDSVQYPCITKPILSKDGCKSDITICNCKEQLINVIKYGSCYRYQVQRFIVKDFEYQLIGLSLNGGDEVIIPGISRCIRPCPGTNTGFLKYVNINSFEVSMDKCKTFVKEIGYSGLFSIEFLRDKSGKDFFLEMNFRNDGNSICVTKAGFNLPYIWYAYNVGFDYKKLLSECVFREVLIMPEFNDFNCFVRTRKIGLWKWLKDIYRTDAFMEYDSKDPKPFWVELKQYIIRAIAKLKQ